MCRAPQNFLFAALAGLGLVSATPAHSEDRPIYRMVWNVDQAAPLESVQVSPGDEILRLKLVPPALYQAVTDVRSAQGSVVIPAGMQLVGIKSDVRMACTFSPMRKAGTDNVLFLGALKRICLIDRTGDGAFDASFERATNHGAFFLLRGRLPERLQDVTPAELAALRPDEIDDGPRLSLKLSRNSRIDGTTTVIGDVGGDEEPISLVFRVKLRPADFPAIVPAYGGAVRLSPTQGGAYTVSASGKFDASELDFWD